MFGRYRLVERLSEGGMSELFIAEAAGVEGFTRTFVLKRLRPELARDKDAVAQFIDEARLQASLVHSNIVPVFDFGVVGGEYFMTQEYIVGRDLGRADGAPRTRAAGRAPLAGRLLRRARDAAGARLRARRAATSDGTPLGIVHRDVAAGNVIVSLAGEVKLSDFGIVKSNDRVSRTQIGVVKGNTNFMSPEQARGQAVDARSDLFSLGLVLYYCLTGELLYAGQQRPGGPPPRRRAACCGTTSRASGGSPIPRRRSWSGRWRSTRTIASRPPPSSPTRSPIHMGGGRGGAAQLMRELFGAGAGPAKRRSRPRPAVGYTAGP